MTDADTHAENGLIEILSRRTGERSAQARGVERRRRLLEAARKCLSERPLDEITYQEIADQAGIPLPSCYHFYSSKLDLVKALAVYLTIPFYEVVFTPCPADQIASWQEIVRLLVRRAVHYLISKTAIRQIFLGPQIPREVRLEPQIQQRDMGHRLMDIIDEHFVLPDVPNAGRVFFNSIEIARLLLSLDEIEYGAIVEKSAEEAARAQIAYLGLYLPPVLKPRCR